MIFSVIDVETTGLSARTGDRILEIGIVQLNSDRGITDRLDTLINPERKVSATQVHGITDGMVEDAPRFRDILPYLSSLLDGTIIAAHNAAFDIGFLREEFRRSKTALPFISPVCTLVMARKYFSTLSSKSLGACRKHLGLGDDGAHNALADARSAAHLLDHFLNEFKAEIEAKPFKSALPDYSGGLFDDEPELKPRGNGGKGT